MARPKPPEDLALVSVRVPLSVKARLDAQAAAERLKPSDLGRRYLAAMVAFYDADRAYCASALDGPMYRVVEP